MEEPQGYGDWRSIRPEEVLALDGPPEGFLCPITANTPGIQFLEFTIRNADTNEQIFHTTLQGADELELPEDLDDLRKIYYTFKKSFLTAKTIGTNVVFTNGPQEVRKFRMIERHYFRGELIKSFDFEFDFCIPESENSWENIYEMPRLSRSRRRDMLKSPNESTSESFYFVGEPPVLIMHNKAFYSYE